MLDYLGHWVLGGGPGLCTLVSEKEELGWGWGSLKPPIPIDFLFLFLFSGLLSDPTSTSLFLRGIEFFLGTKHVQDEEI